MLKINYYMRILLMTIVILQCIILFLFSLDRYYKKLDLELRINSLSYIRQYIYSKIDVSATRDFLLEPRWNASSGDILKMFEKNMGGVWCGGAAQVLSATYREKNMEAYILNFGFPGIFTHAVTLVRIDRDLFVQDAYLNYSFQMPLRELIGQIVSGNVPAVENGSFAYRDVHYHSNNNKQNSWTWDSADPNVICSNISAEHSICRINHTLSHFVEEYPKRNPGWTLALDKVESFGLPRDPASLILFPFGISGTDGWVDSVDSDLNSGLFREIVEMIREATEGRIDPGAGVGVPPVSWTVMD